MYDVRPFIEDYYEPKNVNKALNIKAKELANDLIKLWFWEDRKNPIADSVRHKINQYPKKVQKITKSKPYAVSIENGLTIEKACQKLGIELSHGSGFSKTKKGLCPFHDDRNPSFIIWTQSQTWRCFSCSIGGNASWLVKMGVKHGII